MKKVMFIVLVFAFVLLQASDFQREKDHEYFRDQPSITTIPVVPQTHSILKIGGNATQEGSTSITAKGICWSTNPNPTLSDNFTDEGSGTVEFYSTITNLNPVTQYYYRAYATNSSGTAYGEEYFIIPENIAGFCLEFDGADDYVLMDSNPGLRPANDFTIEAWVKPSNVSGFKVIFMHDDNGGGNDGYILQLVDNKVRFAAMNGGAFQYIDSDETISANQWWHAAGVYHNSVMKVYVNGTEKTLQGTGDIVYEVTDHVNIGRRGGTAAPNTQMFSGEIDEIRFWDIARSETEINENMDKYISPDETGLAGYWYLNESSGTRAYDVANDNHGTLTNMTDDDWVTSNVPLNKVPEVQTTEISNFTSSSADSGGNVTNEGSVEVTERGICWSTNTNPTTADSYTTDGSGSGNFTSILTGLNRSTEYYYRAYATNYYGTSYGDEYSFTTTPEGSGIEVDPYQISDIADLRNLSENNYLWSSDCIQTANIDASDTQNWDNGAGFSPIGDSSNGFTGTYNGQGYEIDGLYIDRAEGAFLGYVENGTISNLGLTNVDLHQCQASLIGQLTSYNTVSYKEITNCYSTGNLVSANLDTGGLIGRIFGYYRIENCYCDVNVSATNDVGGLIGETVFGSELIVNCYSTGNVQGIQAVGGLVGSGALTTTGCYSTGNVSGTEYTGGLIGAGGGEVTNCYSTGNVNGASKTGGLIGRFLGSVVDCYSIGNVSGTNDTGGLIGFCEPGTETVNSFWNTETSGQSSSASGTGLTTSQMTELTTYIIYDWDFVEETAGGSDDVWVYDQTANNGYPFFSWQNLGSMEPYVPQGSGIEADPYQIGSLLNLLWVSRHISEYDKFFIQTADIDVTDAQNWANGTGFIPIGTRANGFSGNYDGQNFVVDNLYINNNDMNGEDCGLFGTLEGANISDLGVINIELNTSSERYIGALAGNSGNYSIITNCYSSGSGVIQESHSGGLVGRNIGYSSIINCYSTIDLISTNAQMVGGLAGINEDNSTIENSFSTGEVTGGLYIGGLVSLNTENSTISNCYSTGNVSGPFSAGLVTQNLVNSTISNCYSSSDVQGNWTSGFLLENTSATVENSYCTGSVTGENTEGFLTWSENSSCTDCFWDMEASGQLTSSGGTGKTTLEMQDAATYADITTAGLNSPWDFYSNPYDDEANDDVWGMNLNENNGYPFLSWQGLENQAMPYGEGIEADPYQIATLDNLLWVSTNSSSWSSHFIQTANIDATDTQNWNSSEGFSPIGIGLRNFFLGSYDGQDFAIDNLYINRPEEGFQGLFGSILDEAIIKNLYLNNIQLTGEYFVGGVSGNNGGALIENCFVSGSINGTNCGGIVGFCEAAEITDCINYANINGDICGGIVGYGYGSIIKNCINHGNIIGIGRNYLGGITGSIYADFMIIECCNYGAIEGDSLVGGLAGDITGRVIIENSFNAGNVAGDTKIGGVVGYLQNQTNPNNGYISNCYNKGSVSGLHKTGGFIGECIFDYNIENCYSSGSVTGSTETGGFIGSNSSNSIQSCFWDMETSGQLTSFGGTGLMTLEMQTHSTFTDAGWDFVYETTNGTEDIWGMNGTDNDGYPFLMWQGYEAGLIPPQNVAIQVVGNNIEITWDDIAGANSYKIFAADSPGGLFVDVTSEGTFVRCHSESNRRAITKITSHFDKLSVTDDKPTNSVDAYKNKNHSISRSCHSYLDEGRDKIRNRLIQIWTAPVSGTKKFYYVQAFTE